MASVISSSAGSVLTSVSDSTSMQVDDLLQTTKMGKVVGMIKLGIISSPSLVVATILTAFNVTNVLRSHGVGIVMRLGVEDARTYSALQSEMAVERGLTCVTLNSVRQNEKAYVSARAQLRTTRDTVDTLFSTITTWYGTKETGSDFSSAKALMANISHFRRTLDDELAFQRTGTSTKNTLDLCSDNIAFYTRKIDILITLGMNGFAQSDQGRFYQALEAFHTWIISEELQRMNMQIGEDAFSAHGFSQIEKKWALIEGRGATKKLQEVTINMLPSVRESVHGAYDFNVRMMKELDGLNFELYRMDENVTVGTGQEESPLWNRDMTFYITVLEEIEKDIWKGLKILIDVLVVLPTASLRNGVMLCTAVLCFVPPIVGWYIRLTRENTRKSSLLMARLQEKSRKLQETRQMADTLMGQMLPKSVSRILKNGGEVSVETFHSASLFFSDIWGFSKLSSSCSPFQIIDLLSALYNAWDAILERFDCYKVETIGDGYVVASGLPLRNGNAHSNEICTLALNFVEAMDHFTIPHLPGHRLIVRVGCHTGPIASGVVGTKMPRYCLFGDTMNTTARILTCSKGMRVQMSTQCKNHLEEYHPGKFLTEMRGIIALKGKGNLETHWLISKQGYPYVIDLERAENESNSSIYCNST